MPKLTPAVKPLPLSFEQMAKEFDKVSAEELKRHGAMEDFDKISQNSPERAAQLTFIDNLISILKASKKYNDEQKALILAGALLDVKAQIAATYNWLNPDRSYIHANIDKMIGSLGANKFDADAKEACQKAFVEYVSETKRLAEVMAGVEKVHLLKFAFRANKTVDATELSTAADLMRKMKPDSKHHVVVQEKALDTSHMVELNRHKRKDHLFEIKTHKFDYRGDPKHYVRTSGDAAEVQEEQLAQINTANKKGKVHKQLREEYKPSKLDEYDDFRNKVYQPLVSELDQIPGFENRRIKDNEDPIKHMTVEQERRMNLFNARNHEVTLFDKAKLKKVEPKVTHDVVAVYRKK